MSGFNHGSRRQFLATTAAGGVLASLGDLGFLAGLPKVSAAEAAIDTRIVQFQPDIEPLVRLLEDTPRERVLEEFGSRIRNGQASYQQVLAALLLAGIRNVQPRPSVGHKFHAVLVVNSAHLASLASPEEHRWLPIFWALDYFKSSQAQDIREGNWTMAAVDESAVPAPHKARTAFVEAMDNWDESAADVAVAGLARSTGATEIFELFSRYGARDFRSIGHKAIFVANAWRTLQCIGWRHSEPVLRSLAYALLMHEGDNPAKRDAEPDRSWRQNVELASQFREDWLGGNIDEAATQEMLATLREATPEDASRKVLELVNRQVAPQAVWDAIFVAASEQLARQAGIVSLHTVTTTNALRFAFDTSSNDDTRRMILLQGAAFATLFRKELHRRGNVGDVEIDKLEPAAVSDQPSEGIETIFRSVGRDTMNAAQGVLGYLQAGHNPRELMNAARVLIFVKGTNSHDYKFSSAVLEDFYKVSPGWRDRYLASSVFQLRGSQQPDNQLVTRARAALA